jgi:hypothetical protein
MSEMLRRLRFLAAVTTAALFAMTSVAAAGGSWTIVASPNPGSANTVGGLVAFSPTEVWGIGSASSSSYAGCHGRTLTSRWNGSAFVVVPAAPTAMCAAVNGVAGSSTSDIWAVGSTNEGRDTHLRHWNGASWATVEGATIPPPGVGRRHRSTSLNSVASLGTDNVWAVGRAEYSDFTTNTLVEHWNGQKWTLVPAAAASGSALTGVTALSASDIWAVGSGGTSGAADLSTLVEHWNGSSWTIVPSPNTNVLNFLRGVSASSANDVWAVGNSIKNPYDGVSKSRTLIEHWDGSTWTVVPSPTIGAGNNSLAAVAARSAHDVWAVGSSEVMKGDIPVLQTLVEHWNGKVWKVVASPNRGDGDNWFSAVVAPAGTRQAFASGTSASGTLVEHFTG